MLETYSTTGRPGAALARPAKPCTVGTDRCFHGTPNVASRRWIRQPVDGSSATTGTFGGRPSGVVGEAGVAGELGVAAALGEAGVGSRVVDPVWEGSGDVGPLGAEHPTDTSTATTITNPSRRLETCTRPH